MDLVLTGRLTEVLDVQVLKGDFQKRTFAIEIEGTYPTAVAFELLKDKVDLIDKFTIGTTITVGYNLRSNRYVTPGSSEVKYFTSLNAWKINAADGSGTVTQKNEPTTYAAPMVSAPPVTSDMGEVGAMKADDLPF